MQVLVHEQFSSVIPVPALYLKFKPSLCFPYQHSWSFSPSCTFLLFHSIYYLLVLYYMGFPSGSVVENLPANAGDARVVHLIPGLGRSSGVGNCNPLQYSCPENSMDRGAWWSAVHGVAEIFQEGSNKMFSLTKMIKKMRWCMCYLDKENWFTILY